MRDLLPGKRKVRFTRRWLAAKDALALGLPVEVVDDVCEGAYSLLGLAGKIKGTRNRLRSWAYVQGYGWVTVSHGYCWFRLGGRCEG